MSIAIAVVDDDPSVRKGLARLLRSAGFAASTFESGEQFLAGGRARDFDCLVLDVHLGGMTGFELFQKLNQSGEVRAVFITAFDESTTRDALRAAGSPPCLRKPFAAEEFLAALNHTLGRPAV